MSAGPTLYNYPILLVFAAAVAVLLLATEFGFRAGRRLGKAEQQRAKFEAVSLQGSVLGLLALLIGFTFSASMTNFQERRLLVVKEANAIGTLFLRAQLLPAPLAQQGAAALRTYADLRLQWARASAAQAPAIALRANGVQRELWGLALRFAGQDRSAVAALFVNAVNGVIDAGAERAAAMSNRLPLQMFALLWLLAIVAMAITGYGCGISDHRARVATTIVSVLIAAVIVLTSDLHDPRQGLITDNLQSLIDQRAAME